MRALPIFSIQVPVSINPLPGSVRGFDDAAPVTAQQPDDLVHVNPNLAVAFLLTLIKDQLQTEMQVNRLYVIDVFMCVPPILLSLAVVAALGTSMRNLIIAITISCILGNVRLIRSVVLTVADQDYVEVARSYGASNARIIFRYVLPNAMGPIIVNTTMAISDMILSAAGLSFIGMGIQPPSPEWGALLSAAQTYIFTSPYLLAFPGVFIILSSLSFNLVGDGLTDALDPKLKD